MAGNRRGSRRQSSMGLPTGADDGGRARKSSMMVRMREMRRGMQGLIRVMSWNCLLGVRYDVTALPLHHSLVVQ